MSLFIYSLVFYALSYCIVYAAGPFNIFTKYREFAQNKFPSNLGDSVFCMFCTPFQLGLLFSLLNIFVFGYTFDVPTTIISVSTSYWYVDMLFDGAFTAAAVYLIDTIQNWFESNTKEEDDGQRT